MPSINLRCNVVLTQCRFANDPYFRRQLKELSWKRQVQLWAREPFRFMDLPPELRLEIAEYAATSATPLYWEWVSDTKGHRVGRFTANRPRSRKRNDLTALSRVSRQLHAETSSLVWKLNTFHINREYFSGYYRMSGMFEYGDEEITPIPIIEVLEFLLPKMPSWTFALMRSIVLEVYIDLYEEDPNAFMALTTTLARQAPNARIRIQDISWDGLDPGNSLAWFAYGRRLKAHLDKLDDAGTPRPDTVKVFPDKIRSMPKDLGDEDKALALEWITNGL